MEHIAIWLKQIIAIIIVAGFMEMILPDNEFKGVTKLVMGLLIISVLIQPLTTVFHLPLDLTASLSTMASDPDILKTRQTIEKGLKLREKFSGVYQEQNQQRLKAKIEKVLNGAGIGKVNRITLTYQGNQLQKILLIMQSLDKNNDYSLRPQLTRKAITMVSSLTDWPEKKIEVIWHASN